MPWWCARPEAPAEDPTAWYDKFGRSFEGAGCRVLRDHTLGWRDLTGLCHVREVLERSVFAPLARETLYRRIARRVMPQHVRVLPRGVLLYGPPGCGKTWSMRVLAAEAGLPVVVLPCDAVLSMWYGESERRLAGVFRLCRQAGRMILLVDELDALARHRRVSHEATSRLISILLTEMDGLADASETLLVGSINDLDSIDAAVLDRFDLRIEFGLPTEHEVQSALTYYAAHLPPEDIAEVAAHLRGCNYRQVSRFAEHAVRTYVAGLNLTQLEATDPPLPRKEDYLVGLQDMP
jgi:SpoVK/Ycf46/Vps4 family AAA+-type ATPase